MRLARSSGLISQKDRFTIDCRTDPQIAKNKKAVEGQVHGHRAKCTPMSVDQRKVNNLMRNDIV